MPPEKLQASSPQYDPDIAEIRADLMLIADQWMIGFTLAFVVGITWCVFA